MSGGRGGLLPLVVDPRRPIEEEGGDGEHPDGDEDGDDDGDVDLFGAAGQGDFPVPGVEEGGQEAEAEVEE